MTLHLVRHGRSLTDPTRPAAEWELDPAGFDDVWALRERLPSRASWFCSPAHVAQETAQLLTDSDVGIVDELAEHEPAERLLPAVRRILDVHGDDDVVPVGHATAWTLLVAELTGSEGDPLGMPDVVTVPSRLR
ncbi:phosphoglycerate mutase family protein [Nocardioides sp. B-3]|uniref:phosphoglycerate mutase family protein n=1 Tax=Nocardioides sp. B-3 TaxID=2895565 RepID=UPI002152E14F|nr:phosphoglycerate mutase family protein [Nocardioides sp. B-3]UUZ59803.1 histidine phosphatase family protein [Nocardioides sp. B-3]